MNQRITSTNGNARVERPHDTPPQLRERALPAIARPRPEEGKSTGDALVAIARDTLDVATELVRDGVSLARLEAQRAVNEVAPRFAWGALAMVCGATASVCAIVAIMIALGAIVPSVAARLAILAGVLFLVAFFGSIRALRPGPRASATAMRETESPTTEYRSEEELQASRPEQSRSSMLPPPGA